MKIKRSIIYSTIFREKFLKKANKEFAKLKRNKKEWKKYQEELEEWDVTLSNGLTNL